MRRNEIRVRKIEFSNDFSMNEFRINPNIKFNARELKLKEGEEKEGHKVYSVQCNVLIEQTNENRMPIRLDVIVEGMFEFIDETQEQIDKFMKRGAPEAVYASTRAIVSSVTAQAGGVSVINLPLIDFERQGEAQQNTAA